MSERSFRVFVWVLVLCSMVLMMIVIGGVTRLTGSGLSIVEWKPLMGAIPPLTESDWLEVFAQYQASPQYQLVNRGMSLGHFQWIFFGSFHRLIGRLMGVVFLIPWLVFWWKGYFNSRWAGRFLLGFSLGGLQALLGWVMVASGLIDQPQVSHYRLAAHLSLAFFILAYFWRLGWEFYTEANTVTTGQGKVATEIPANGENTPLVRILSQLKRALNLVLALLIVQIVYGAFVAGLRAGYMYNTFPDMEGQFFPQGATMFNPFWKNFFENSLMVQWLHRTLGWTLLIACLSLYFYFRSKVPRSIQKTLMTLAAVVTIQFILGAATLLLRVSLPVAVVHQVGASVVMLILLWLRWEVQAHNGEQQQIPQPVLA